MLKGRHPLGQMFISDGGEAVNPFGDTITARVDFDAGGNTGKERPLFWYGSASDYLALILHTTVNEQPKSDWDGASAPSTYPSDMGWDLNGLTSQSITGIGSETVDGVSYDYLEVTLVNTSGSAKGPEFRVVTNSQPTAAKDEIWTSSCYIRVVSGAASAGMRIREWSGGGGGSNNGVPYTALTSSYQRVQDTYTLQDVATTGLRHGIQCVVDNGVTAVIRLLAPQPLYGRVMLRLRLMKL